MSKAIREHYVQQSYLRRFTYDGERLWVFDKSERDSFSASIRNVACERGFYGDQWEEVGLEAARIEQLLSRVESTFASIADGVVDKLAAGEAPSQADKGNLAYMVYFQLIRTREARELQVEASEKMDTAIRRMIENMATRFDLPEGAKVEYPPEYRKEDAALIQLKLMSSKDSVRRGTGILINEYDWRVGVNRTRQLLYTSDNPVVKEHDHRLGVLGDIALPLNPHYIIALGHIDTLGKSVPDKACSLIDLNEKNVLYYNRLQVLGCYRQIYCPKKSFGQARRVCNRHPEWCRPDRQRIGNPIMALPPEPASD